MNEQEWETVRGHLEVSNEPCAIRGGDGLMGVYCDIAVSLRLAFAELHHDAALPHVLTTQWVHGELWRYAMEALQAAYIGLAPPSPPSAPWTRVSLAVFRASYTPPREHTLLLVTAACLAFVRLAERLTGGGQEADIHSLRVHTYSAHAAMHDPARRIGSMPRPLLTPMPRSLGRRPRCRPGLRAVRSWQLHPALKEIALRHGALLVVSPIPVMRLALHYVDAFGRLATERARDLERERRRQRYPGGRPPGPHPTQRELNLSMRRRVWEWSHNHLEKDVDQATYQRLRADLIFDWQAAAAEGVAPPPMRTPVTQVVRNRGRS
ncbi:ORF132 [Ranid herpesvirus 1]|uniref:ORF132 n=1 Tax=Ranid herpesvirus 1 TaxID=85655 RepID=Q14VJ8_9VIRU|nr:ORF132 [Ranid herpesvirus 1]ABG25756.1 ORF132 [Ranid herpesvirus 1]